MEEADHSFSYCSRVMLSRPYAVIHYASVQMGLGGEKNMCAKLFEHARMCSVSIFMRAFLAARICMEKNLSLNLCNTHSEIMIDLIF